MAPREHQDGTSETFAGAHTEFEDAWQRVLPQLSDEALEEWRDHHAMMAWNREMHDRGLPLPVQMTDGRSQCFCGIEITLRTLNQHIMSQHVLYEGS